MEQNFPKSSQLPLESLTACLLTLCNLELKTSALISSLSERKVNEEEKSQYKKVYIVLESGKKKIASEAHWQRHTSYSIVAQKFSH